MKSSPACPGFLLRCRRAHDLPGQPCHLASYRAASFQGKQKKKPGNAGLLRGYCGGSYC
jgi:hypothetical protein